jgi:hypothetical protein
MMDDIPASVRKSSCGHVEKMPLGSQRWQNDRGKSATCDVMMRTILRAIAAVVGLFALGLQFWLMLGNRSLPGLFATTIKFFSYFTMLSNALAVCAMVAPLAAPASRVGRFLSKPSVRLAITEYLIVVAAVYYVFLRNIGDDHGWERFADQLMHYVTPALFMLDWLAFVPKGQVRCTILGTSLITPVVYGIWILLHGAHTAWYPYPFFNAAKFGYPRTLAHLTFFLGMFISVALALIVIDRVIASLRHRNQS